MNRQQGNSHHSQRNPVTGRYDHELIAGVYDRVSKEGKYDRGRSVDQQFIENSAACQEFGYRIGERYTDPNISASRYTDKVRTNWQRLLADLEAGKFQVLVLWEPSRGDRKNSTWSVLLEACQAHKILIHITTHRRAYDMSLNRDWETLAIEGVKSESYSRETSARVRRDMKATALTGKPHGKISYGYERIYDASTKMFTAQRAQHGEGCLKAPLGQRGADEACVVEEIIRQVSQSVPINAIQRDLNERGIPAVNGRPWTHQAVLRTARAVTYIGKRRHNGGGELIDGDWEPIVDEATFYAAQRVLSDPARQTTRPGRQKWMLSYLAQCGVCGGPLAVGQRSGQTAHYRCIESGCVSLSLRFLDQFISDLVCRRTAAEDVYRNVAQASDADVVAAQADVNRWLSEIDDLLAEYKAERLSARLMGEGERDRQAKIKAAEKRMKQAPLSAVVRDLAEAGVETDTAEERLADVQARWNTYGIGAKRDVIRNLCSISVTRRVTAEGEPVSQADRVLVRWNQWGDE